MATIHYLEMLDADQLHLKRIPKDGFAIRNVSPPDGRTNKWVYEARGFRLYRTERAP